MLCVSPAPITDIERLRERAVEAEALGDIRRARALLAHRRRADANCVDSHLDVAAFEARVSSSLSALLTSTADSQAQPDQAQQASLSTALSSVKAALEVDPGHHQALLLLGCLCLESLSRGANTGQQQGAGEGADGVPQAEALSLGIAAGHALLDVTSGSSLAWALLSQVYEAGAMPSEARSCTQELRRRERATVKGAQKSQKGVQQSEQEGVQQVAGQEGEAASPVGDTGASQPDGVQQPWQAAGVLALWSACLELCLPCAAARVQAAALTTFRRSTGTLLPLLVSALTSAGAACSNATTAAFSSATQLEVLLLVARTSMLLGCSNAAFARAASSSAASESSAAGAQQSGEQSPDRQTGDDTSAEETASPLHADTWLGLADVALRMARRQLEGDGSSQGRSDVRALLLTGDLALVRAELEQQASGTSQGPGVSRQSRLQAVRSAYQAALQAVAATTAGAGTQVAPPPSSAANALAAATAPAPSVPWPQLLRASLFCASSYLVDAHLPEAAGNVYSTVANLWPHCAAAWAGAAQAALQAGGKLESSGVVATTALCEANLLDRLDGEVWAQLAHASFR
jgi:hypothetical protein